MMRWMLVLGLCMWGCATAGERLRALDRDLAVAYQDLLVMESGGAPTVVLEAKRDQLRRLEEARALAGETAREESQASKAIWLALLAVVTGGMKLALDGGRALT